MNEEKKQYFKWAFITLGVTLAIGWAITCSIRPTTHPFTVSEADRIENDKLNKIVLEKGGVMGPGGNPNALKKEIAEKIISEGFEVLELSGEHKRDGKLKAPQLIPLEKNYLKRIWEMNECVRREFGTDMRVDSGLRLNFQQARLCNELKGSVVPCDKYGESKHNYGQGADIEQIDAYGEIPLVKVNNEVITLTRAIKIIANNEPEKTPLYKALQTNSPGVFDKLLADDKDMVAKVYDMAVKGALGLEDLAMECGMEAGLVGGFCSIEFDPWHYMPAEYSSEEVRNCTRGSERYIRLKKLQAEKGKSPYDIMEEMGAAAAEKFTEAVKEAVEKIRGLLKFVF